MIKSQLRLFALVLLFSVLQYASFRSHSASNPKPNSRFYYQIEGGRFLISQLLDKFPGISIAVGIDDQVVWKEAFGWADAENGINATPAHQFRYYSLSKSIAGLAAAKLMEEGKLDIDTAITTYLPDLPEQYCNVSVAQLLSHTAGVRHYKKSEWQKISRYHCDSVAMALPVFLDDPLEFEPGTGYTYTSFGYVLLCYVLEKVSGIPYDEYIHQNFIDPLGLETIGLDQSPIAKIQPVKFYEYWNVYKNRGKEAPKVDNSCKFGGGGYVGTAADLLGLYQALLKGKLLQPQTVEKYFTSFTKKDSTSVKYAFGIGVKTAEDGSKYYAHTGTAMGGYGVLVIDPECGFVMVMLGNRYDPAMVKTATEIVKRFRNVL